MIELAFRPDERAREPVYRQLSTHLETLIASGHLRPGEKLPATRELATSLGLSRNTVNQAYEWLAEAELVRAHVGQGTFVAEPVSELAPAATEGAARPGLAWEGLFSRRVRHVENVRALAASLDPGPDRSFAFDLRGGRVDTSALPVAEIRRAHARVLSDQLPELANRLDPQGEPGLRSAIAERLVARGIRCSAGDVVVTAGAQQGLDLIARLLVDPGDRVALEDPGYFGARLVFQGCDASLVGIPVDAEGLRVDALERSLRGGRLQLLYLTPSAQCPTGVSLSAERRAQLLRLAERHQMPIVEDDYDCELRLEGRAEPALKARDEVGQVLYVGTFSKVLFPALRLGYVVAPPALRGRLASLLAASQFGTSALDQAALAEWIRNGSLERHVRRMRRRLSERRSAVLEALEAEMPEGSHWLRPEGGNLVTVVLPPGVDAGAVWRALLAQGVACDPGALFHLVPAQARSLVLAYGATEPGSLREAVARIAEQVRAHIPRRNA